MNSNRKAQAKDAILMETALRRLKKSPDFIVDVGVRAGTPPRNAQLNKRLLGGQMRAFNQFNDLQLLRGRISPTPPSPSMLFFEQAVLKGEFSDTFLQLSRLGLQPFNFG